MTTATQPLSQALQGTSVYLIGMMGSGKSTVGQLLAAQLGYQFLDTDSLIEQAVGQSVSEIFAESGEAVFRELETRTLAELTAYGRKLIATGGGIVLKPENWGYLRNGVIVWLDVPVEVLLARLQADTTRPLLQQGDLEDRLRSISSQRRDLYAQADLKITIAATDSPEAICDRIGQALAQACREKLELDAETERLNRLRPYQLENN